MAQQKQTTLRTIAFVSLGCPKNLIDSEKMLGLLAEDGIAITPSHEDADAIIINTCGFLEASKTESLQVIREAVALKQKAAKAGRVKRIIVVGCLVQRHKTQLLAEVPEIDALVGVFDRNKIVQAVRGPSTPPPFPVTTFINRLGKVDIGKGYTESELARLRLTPRHYAYLRISEGCSRGCSFCTIPSIRGRMRSKRLGVILAEAEELFDDGAVELNLVGQDTTCYGQDIGYNAMGNGEGWGFRALLQALDRKAIKRGAWIRLMYAYPSRFTDDMIKTIVDCQSVVKYLDMPLQHINDEILHNMRRRVTRKQIETLLSKLRKWVPGIALRTTFITGFPGETTAQHKELLQFIKDFRFENLGVFEFSPEPNTPAARLPNPVPPSTAAKRKEELMLAQQQIVLQNNQSLIGQTLPVLIDDVNPKQKTAIARHPGQAPEVDSCVYLTHCAASPGEIINAKIESHNYYDLIARPAGPPKRKTRLSLPII